ncbi:aminotransferase class I/II-fold pyridoxal phosphate-dependent enzyme [Helicobacter cetorum]|uniref:8-amino-7-oxononanoate synthase n=1 Tax=Helicobacter cetorum (strain ATCC BAA-540 / CCUG 52418 / MIT 99-5656) TaxID=1163745 RepID=I0EQR5_HELCM|nr:pyridoxal phosphate-dependent aminotransferase family protein [Helicobacter cetorum]AFI05284.1 8-amino-7-oxononanoate synthase [Helicobacter cetorum MIT 99-5656]
MFSKQLEALRRTKRYRKRELFSPLLKDYASNDYLGLSVKKDLLEKAFKKLQSYDTHAPKASMLVNGYHPLHAELEEQLARLLGFENALLVGSGFLGNLALIDTLLVKNALLFIDEHYHASGVFSTKIKPNQVIFFSHNNAKDLRQKLLKAPKDKLKFVAIEGVYSMDASIAPYAIYESTKESPNTFLIVDEAHSFGTIGDNLLGFLEYYHIQEKERIIKLSTFSKALASYGACILASSKIIDFLVNRAKSVIYTTALSLLDTALSLAHLEYFIAQKKELKKKLKEHQQIIFESLGISTPTGFFTLEFENNSTLLNTHHFLKEKGFLVGAIRPPTVSKPLLRISLSLKNSLEDTKELATIIRNLSYNKVSKDFSTKSY